MPAYFNFPENRFFGALVLENIFPSGLRRKIGRALNWALLIFSLPLLYSLLVKLFQNLPSFYGYRPVFWDCPSNSGSGFYIFFFPCGSGFSPFKVFSIPKQEIQTEKRAPKISPKCLISTPPGSGTKYIFLRGRT